MYALTPWAEKVGQQAMWQVLQDVPTLSLEAAQDRIKNYGLTADDQKEAGGERGGHVHDYLESYIRQGIPADPALYPDSIAPYLVQLGHFLADYEPEFLGSEFYLVHCELGYAGRCDGICRINKQPARRNKPIDLAGKLCLFDLKTNKDGKVFAPKHLYQVAGYRHAWDWLGGEPLDHEIVVAVGLGSYQCKPSKYEARSFEDLVGFYHSMETEKAR
jgi:hypothetical protein